MRRPPRETRAPDGRREETVHERCNVRVFRNRVCGVPSHLSSVVNRGGPARVPTKRAQVTNVAISVPQHWAKLRNISQWIEQPIFTHPHDESIVRNPDRKAVSDRSAPRSRTTPFALERMPCQMNSSKKYNGYGLSISVLACAMTSPRLFNVTAGKTCDAYARRACPGQ